jgi:hypothetical protein
VASVVCAKHRDLASNLAIAFRGETTASALGTDPLLPLHASYLFNLSNNQVDMVSRWRKANRKLSKILSVNRSTIKPGSVKVFINNPYDSSLFDVILLLSCPFPKQDQNFPSVHNDL